MNDQLDRIHDYCDKLKLHTMMLEWSAIADSAARVRWLRGKEESYLLNG